MDHGKKIDEFVEKKLRNAGTFKPSVDFTSGLMFRLQEENKLAKEELKRDRIAKYVIGCFSGFVVVVTILVGILSGTQTTSKVTNSFSIGPTIETSNNYLQIFLNFMGNMFGKIIGYIGLSNSSNSIAIIFVLLLAVTLFMLADKILIRGKLKSR